jgi:hypothetical protein
MTNRFTDLTHQDKITCLESCNKSIEEATKNKNDIDLKIYTEIKKDILKEIYIDKLIGSKTSHRIINVRVVPDRINARYPWFS